METFSFKVLEKVTIWMTTDVEIEAKNLDEAKNEIISKYQNGEIDELPWHNDDESPERLSLADNQDYSTVEIVFEESKETIWQNGIG